jgi:hypothetical protein
MDEPEPESEDKIFPRRRLSAAIPCTLAVVLVLVIWPKFHEPDQVRLSPLNSIQSVTAQDIGVYQSFLAHHPHDFLVDAHANPLVCVNSTESSDGIPSLSSYLDTHCPARKEPPYWLPYNDKYNQLREALYTRNEKSVPIPRFATSIPVTFGPPSSYPDSYKGEWTNCDMYFSLPVYDADNSTALLAVRSETFSEGSPTCIYVMSRHGSSWSVNSVEWDGAGPATECR